MLVEVPSLPGVLMPSPEDRGRCPRLVQPGGAGAPQLRTGVPAVVHEGGELRVRHRCAGHRERGDLHRMRPLLVVIGERIRPQRTQQVRAARDVHVAGQRPSVDGRSRRTAQARQLRCRVAQGLPGVGDRLGVDVLVQDGVEREMTHHVGAAGVQQPRNGAVPDLGHVGKGLLPRRQLEPPPGVVRDGARVVDRVGVRQDRRLLQRPAQDEPFGEPRQVPDLPEQRVHGRQNGADELLVGEIDDEVHRALPGVVHPLGQLLGGQRIGGGQVGTHRAPRAQGAARPARRLGGPREGAS